MHARSSTWDRRRAALVMFVLASTGACKSNDAGADAGAPAASASGASAASVAVTAAASSATAALSAAAGPGMDAGRASDGGPDYAAGECPDFDPDRWAPFEVMSESECWFFTPVAKDKLPRNLKWVPCGRDELGPRCRKLELPSGERLSFGGSVADYRAAAVPAGGKGPPRLQLMLECARQRSIIYVAADLDGAVFGTMAIDPSGRCDFEPTLLAGGWGAQLRILDPKADLSDDTGFVPERVERGLRAARGQLAPTKLPGALPAEGPDDAKLLARWRKEIRTAAVSAALGVPRVGFLSAVFFGVDGNDVVWSGGDLNGTCTVLTGRYAEDPSQVVATRVVELRCKDIATAWTMGCGWAGTSTNEGQALLVRLKDGMSYRIPKLSAPLDTSTRASSSVLAISCSEAIVAAGGATATVLRIPLDSLQGGTPAPEPPRPLASTGDADAGTDAGP